MDNINFSPFSFPFSSDAKARFKLFKKGSGLEVIEEEMATCVEIQKSIEIELKRRREVRKNMDRFVLGILLHFVL